MEKDNLGLRSTEISPQSIGVAYIVVPSNIDRDVYIQSVQKNKTVMMRTEDGNLYKNVVVSEHVIQKLKYPQDDLGFGSLVVYVNIPKGNKRAIVGIIDLLSQAAKILSENQYSISEISDTSSVSTIWDADNDELNISLAANEDGIKTKLNITVANPDRDAEINLEVTGNVNVSSTDTITLMANEKLDFLVEDEDEKALFEFNYTKGTGLTVFDEFKNQLIMDKDKVQLYNKAGDKYIEMNKNGLSFGSTNKSAEAAVLGNTLDKLIKQFISIVQGLIIPSPLGPLVISPNDAASLTKLSEQIDTILSKVSTLD